MSKPLIIVESPTKAKTISRFIGPGYIVESSYGHIRDLPKSKLSVDVENNYEPTYEIPPGAVKRVEKLKELVAKTDLVILATDEDREGEAIAWHLMTALNIKKSEAQRIVFHEITKPAIAEALEHPRKLDMNMVDAQQARRVLDRLVGYKLSPLIWKKIAFGLSAGRVQSVAVRLIVEKEEEIEKFVSEEYWSITGQFKKSGAPEIFEAKLSKLDGKSLDKMEIKDGEQADKILKTIQGSDFIVSSVDKNQVIKKTPAPFTTSTMQQEGSKRHGFSAKQTMTIAQKLYEGIKLKSEGQTGLITYMRTDSTNLAKTAVEAVRSYIRTNYGEKYLPKTVKVYASKQKGAQEAHEAIRPSDITRTPESLKEDLDPNEYRLYKLIWERTMACQMADAIMDSIGIDIIGGPATFRATGSTIAFDGFLKVYETSVKENLLPPLEVKEKVEAVEITPEQHFTQPPARYTEAGLIKILEEYGIGRPSTYAPTITTIQTRKYVIKNDDKRFAPTDVGRVVNKLLVNHFPDIVDVNFTAKMEEDLDAIAEGKLEWQPFIGSFYVPFEKLIAKNDKEIDKKEYTEEKTDILCDKCGKPMIKKMGRFGRFLACTNYPECKNTRPLEGETPLAEDEPTTLTCRVCNKPMVIKTGRYGKYLACSEEPKDHPTESLAVKIGLQCPKCNEGEIIEKKSKRGKLFYACSRYPECDNAYWNKPVVLDGKPMLCPKCKKIMIEAGKTGYKCSECDYKEKKTITEVPQTPTEE